MKFTATKTKLDSAPFTYAVPADSANDDADRSGYIATSAYYMAEARGFMPGHELDDWLKAEAEVKSHGEKS